MVDSTERSIEDADTLLASALRPKLLANTEGQLQREAIAAALFGVDDDADELTPADTEREGTSETIESGSPSEGAAPPEARRLGHYRILGELGRGGMGVVYVAHDTKLDRKVAIKQLRATGLSSNRRRLIREALAMAKVSHPNVIPIYEIGERGGSTFIVMEYVEGMTLRGWLETPRTQAEILGTFKAAARGLIAAHQKGVIHRDFKPDNVMVGVNGCVRVMDFGLARANADTTEPERDDVVDLPAISDPLTQSGAILGTPAYMSPEQLLAEPVDAAGDQFSFCVALYEALYGERPFHGESFVRLRAAVVEGKIRALPSHTSVPSQLHGLVCRGLAPRPEHRFESMQALLDAIIEAELALDTQVREPPEYVFVAHDGVDKSTVLRLCEALIDLGVRPWLDMWELAPSQDWRAALESALDKAPVVLVCHGPRGWPSRYEHALALAARLERAPSTVYRVGLPGASSRDGLPTSERCSGVDLDENSWDDGILELAQLIGIDRARADWLAREADHARLAQTELSPYRGLQAFREQDARWMFGREQEVGELIDLIRADQTRFLTVIGASGSGKSSLLMAGVCPALRNGVLGDRNWTTVYMRPGARPCEALAQALTHLLGSDGDNDEREILRLRDELLDGDDTLRTLMTRRREGRVLLVIDQLEELFTEARLGDAAESEPGPREALACICNLLEATHAMTSSSGLWIAATLRADFVQRCLEVAMLAHVLKGGTYFALPPMGERQIRAAIERPAARVGFRVEGMLVEKLVAAAADQAGRLPLLQHVLLELWARRDERERVLSHAVYAETGGLEGAIAVAAERALDRLRAELGDRAERVTRQVMTRLVHLGDRSSGDTRRRVRVDELGGDATTRRVLDAFVGGARVLVAAEVEGVEVIEIAHEALLREWVTLAGWLAADREALRLRQELAKDADRRGGHSESEYLWGRGRVEEAHRVLAASVVELNEIERAFLTESERAVRGRRRLIQGLLAGVVVVAAVVAVVMAVLGASAVTARDEAETAQTEAVQQREQAVRQRDAAAVAQSVAEQEREKAVQAQLENGRLLQRMFQAGLRRFIESLAQQGSLSGEVEVDERWTPLLERKGQRFVAATVVDKGRIIIAGHDDVLSVVDQRGESLFIEMAVKWLLGEQGQRRILIISNKPEMLNGHALLLAILSTLKYEYDIDSAIDDDALERVGMLIIDNRSESFTVQEIARIDAFIRRGGGMLAVGTGWSWLAAPASDDVAPRVLANYPMNQLLRNYGAGWNDRKIEDLDQLEEEASVQFVNQLDVDVSVFTLDSGREDFHATLRPAQQLDRVTAVGREWVVRRADDGSVISKSVMAAKEQTVWIGRKSPNPTATAHTAETPDTPDLTDAEIPKMLSDGDMTQAKHKAETAALECGKIHGSLRSSLKVTFTVTPDGKVEDARVEVPGLSIGDCLERAVADQRFPKSRSGANKTWDLPLK